jgi:hypothetical protein
MGVELTDDDRAALDPWGVGMIGAVFAAVRRWLERPVREPGIEACIAILSESIWLQINGMALARGLNLPDLPVAELLQALNPADGGSGAESRSEGGA